MGTERGNNSKNSRNSMGHFQNIPFNIPLGRGGGGGGGLALLGNMAIHE